MKEIRVFNHKMFGAIRTTTNEQGQPLFVGKDVAEALGYKNTPKAIQQHVDEEDKGTLPIRESAYETRAIVINESGLYSLILSSKLPQAKAFKRWVTSEVLPQIRKTGGYIPTKDAQGRQLTEQEIVALGFRIQERTIETQKRTIAAQKQQIAVMAPKADYCDKVLESVSCFTTSQIAKELNMTVHDLTRLLLELKVMYRQSGQYMLYADYARKGYARNRTHSYRDGEGELHTRTYLVWTERGRRMIHRVCRTEEIMFPFLLGE